MSFSRQRLHLGKYHQTSPSTPESVTECAHSLRRMVEELEGSHLPRLIGAATPDPSRVGLGRTDIDEWTFGVNSWAALERYDLDWDQVVGGRFRIQESKMGMSIARNKGLRRERSGAKIRDYHQHQ